MLSHVFLPMLSVNPRYHEDDQHRCGRTCGLGTPMLSVFLSWKDPVVHLVDWTNEPVEPRMKLCWRSLRSLKQWKSLDPERPLFLYTTCTCDLHV